MGEATLPLVAVLSESSVQLRAVSQIAGHLMDSLQERQRSTIGSLEHVAEAPGFPPSHESAMRQGSAHI